MCAVCGKVWCGFVGSECVLSVGKFGVGLGELVCAACGTDWCGFVGVSVCCV